MGSEYAAPPVIGTGRWEVAIVYGDFLGTRVCIGQTCSLDGNAINTFNAFNAEMVLLSLFRKLLEKWVKGEGEDV